MTKPKETLRFLFVVRYDEYRKSDESYIGHLGGIIVRKFRKRWIPLKNGVIRVEPTMRWRNFTDCIVSFPPDLIEVRSDNPLFNDYRFIPDSSGISFFMLPGSKLISYDDNLVEKVI